MHNPAHQDHNHQHCIQDALQRAQALCKDKGVRLTKIRQRVLELVWQSHKPMGAYDLLPLLEKDGFNSAPPTVYRALDFLQEQGLIHRIASLNAFLGCSHPGEQHQGFFLICQECGNALEVTDSGFDKALTKTVQQNSFNVQQTLLEVSGICQHCQEQAYD